MGHTIPPRQHAAYWLTRLRKHLVEDRCLDSGTIEGHICVARVFLRYLGERKILLKAVTPVDLEQYLRQQRRAYRSRHGKSPHDPKHWRSYYTAPIHHLLRVAQGSWPPLKGFEAHIEKLRAKLEQEHLSPGTVRGNMKAARCILLGLRDSQILPEHAVPRDVDTFLEKRLEVYRRSCHPSPDEVLKWRARYRKAACRVLECIHGQWPPQSATEELPKRFEAHLSEQGVGVAEDYRRHARLFLEYLAEQEIDPAKVQPADVDAYFKVALRRSKRRHPNLVSRPHTWRRIGRRVVSAILRLVQGEWPPGSRPSPLIGKFREHLEQRGYSYGMIPFAVASANQFLRYLQRIGTPVESARTADVAAFIEEKRKQYEKRHGGAPPSERKWRSGYTGPIRRMLRLIDPQWPRPEPPHNESERFQRELLEGYGRWLIDDHGLSAETLKKNGDAAKHFLCWLESDRCRKLTELAVPDLDAYLARRLPALRRSSRNGVCNALRSFLRYLHSRRLVSRDLSSAVSGTILYRFEEIPRALSEDQVQAVLRCTRKDHSAIGLRDYAMLLLLATYGLRAGEVTRLRMEDIDWREERLRIRHSKTGYESFLPLVTPVGEAVVEYLQKGRPQSSLRHVFLQAIAPYQSFQRGGSLCTIIRYRLQKAGVKPKGHQGAHAFRFARAHSLLSASVPIKAIGDLLGHRSADSTSVYLKLVTEDLRAIGLELPPGAKTCGVGPTKKKRS